MTLLQHASEHRHGRAELDVAAVFAKIHAHLRGREASGLPSGRASDDLRGPDRRQGHPQPWCERAFRLLLPQLLHCCHDNDDNCFYHYYYTITALTTTSGLAATTTTTTTTTTTSPDHYYDYHYYHYHNGPTKTTPPPPTTSTAATTTTTTTATAPAAWYAQRSTNTGARSSHWTASERWTILTQIWLQVRQIMTSRTKACEARRAARADG